jgi:hypothetical protein
MKRLKHGMAHATLVAFLSGCSTVVNISPDHTQRLSHTVVGPKQDAVISSVRLTVLPEPYRTFGTAGLERTEALERSILKYKLQSTKLFSRIIDVDEVDADSRVFSFKLTVSGSTDEHRGAAIGKAIVTGLTLMLAAPFMRHQIDYDETVTLEVVRWDGEKRAYTESGAGSASFHLLAAANVEGVLMRETHSRVLDALMNRVVQDSTFYLAD